VGIQKVRWDNSGNLRTGNYVFFLWKRKGKASVVNRVFFVHHNTVSAVKKVEIVSDKTPYIVLKGRWYNNIIVLNVHE
jgi:hypothetical protein